MTGTDEEIDMADPWQLLTASQKKALDLLTDTFDGVVSAGRAGASGIAHPEETLERVTALIAAVGDLAASSTKPMESLLTSQRNLANAMTAFAALQLEMAQVVEKMAASHTAVVDAMEMLASPALGISEMIRSEPVVKKARARTAKSTAATTSKSTPKKK